ncbi:SDR family NAD(P)-dependent oxidoreductase [Streptomyces incarnatus]|nr:MULTISPECIES: SDR family NAD(P)-dependent oxidoreductase [Streptomyces]
MGKLDGRVVVVTGAARGQGEQEARLFRAEGARVVVTDVLDDRGEALAEEIGARYVHLDVGSEEGWGAAVAAAKEAYGRIDGLVNNAGVLRIAVERGQDPFRCLVEICADDRLRTVLWPMPTDNDPASWALRAETWRHEDVLLGGSDAGAHLDRMCGAPYTTRFLGDCLRGRKLVGPEQAVKMLTDDPARLFGLRERGRIQRGWHADLVLLDPERIDAGQARLVHDLPGDSPRLDSRAIVVRAVWVGGVETIRDDVVSGAVPGKVLRSGRDTRTVGTR